MLKSNLASSRDQGWLTKYVGFLGPPLQAALSMFKINLFCLKKIEKELIKTKKTVNNAES